MSPGGMSGDRAAGFPGSAVAVLGGGAWGTALAQVIASDGTAVSLWARDPAVVAEINAQRSNAAFLPGVALSDRITATTDLARIDAAVVLAVVPAQFVGAVLAGLPAAAQGQRRDVVLCAKGIEAGSGASMAAVARAALPSARLAVLSGPTFAREVARGLPTAVTLACAGGEAQWARLSPLIARAHFRPYYSDDVTGAEIGGAVKNVLAIACGAVDGLGLGENARAALIARGFAEMLRFGAACGARAETLSGLSGLGDLVLTCASAASRNYALGRALGAGMSAEAALAGKRSIAEGAATAPVLAAVAARAGVAMPIVDGVCRVLAGAPARGIAADLLARPLRPEHGQGAMA